MKADDDFLEADICVDFFDENMPDTTNMQGAILTQDNKNLLMSLKGEILFLREKLRKTEDQNFQMFQNYNATIHELEEKYGRVIRDQKTTIESLKSELSFFNLERAHMQLPQPAKDLVMTEFTFRNDLEGDNRLSASEQASDCQKAKKALIVHFSPNLYYHCRINC